MESVRQRAVNQVQSAVDPDVFRQRDAGRAAPYSIEEFAKVIDPYLKGR